MSGLHSLYIREGLLSLLMTLSILLLGLVLGRWAPGALTGPWATGIAAGLVVLTHPGWLSGGGDSLSLRLIAFVSLAVLSAHLHHALGLLP